MTAPRHPARAERQQQRQQPAVERLGKVLGRRLVEEQNREDRR